MTKLTKPPLVESIRQIDITKIDVPDEPDRFRPGDVAIDELAASIHEHGLLQPILVSTSSDDSFFHLIVGQRRLLATLSLGHTTIACRVIDSLPKSIEALRLTENVQRQDLTPLEEAVAIKRWRDQENITQATAAELLGKGLSWLKRREFLLHLPDDVMDALQFGQVNPSVAIELGRIDDDHVRKYYLQSAVDYGATQDVASAWVYNYLREGSTPSTKEISEISDNVRKASSGHKLPCYVCEHSFPLNQLSNFFACSPCIEAVSGAARHVPDNHS